jgi:hypothetical protein
LRTQEPPPSTRRYAAFAVLLIILYFVGRRLNVPEQVPSVPLQSLALTEGAGDPCAAAEVCLAVYITPWCPYCQQAAAALPALDRRLKEQGGAGLKVIVGQDSAQAIQTMAAAVGLPLVYADPDGRFLNAMGGGGVPQWWVWSQAGKVLKRWSGAAGSNPQQIIDYAVRQVSRALPEPDRHG